MGIILWTFLNENVLMKAWGKFCKNLTDLRNSEKYDRINYEKKNWVDFGKCLLNSKSIHSVSVGQPTEKLY